MQLYQTVETSEAPTSMIEGTLDLRMMVSDGVKESLNLELVTKDGECKIMIEKVEIP